MRGNVPRSNFPHPNPDRADGIATDSSSRHYTTHSHHTCTASRTSRRRARSPSKEQLQRRYEALIAARIDVSDYREQAQLEHEELCHELVEISQSQGDILDEEGNAAQSHDPKRLFDLQRSAKRSLDTYNARLANIRQLQRHLAKLEQTLAERDADFVVAAEYFAISRPVRTPVEHSLTSAEVLHSLKADVEILQERLVELDYARHEDEIYRNLLLDRDEVLSVADDDFYKAYSTKREVMQRDLEQAERAVIEHERTVGTQRGPDQFRHIIPSQAQSSWSGQGGQHLDATIAESDFGQPESTKSWPTNSYILPGDAVKRSLRQSKAPSSGSQDRVYDWIDTVRASRDGLAVTRRNSLNDLLTLDDPNRSGAFHLVHQVSVKRRRSF
ncbi:uncharacterized protein CLAFUR5_05827 [Fulvia fulva]|uniref:Uncharacterized protein n=1 Tax=Passalora fulva TaxID=5499 RepID=A0A9Q8LJ77_PASFU|nr:uncharacterized protein CLAFUR5_05827 [Fulvia fulva]KAK4625668.1 hypothetical protein CLAFUR0_05688 [Fulvia fulva]UJO17588.1 hypothetical protein CLAFUR5_05827 [Fulvia fulva]